jgi:hypothetical protein
VAEIDGQHKGEELTNLFGVQFYGKTLMLKRGIALTCCMTFRCNLSCDYCANRTSGHGLHAKSDESNFEEWMNFFRMFPVKVREIFVSGGEPTLMSWTPDLVTHLMDTGRHVTLVTNLHNADAILKIKPRYCLQITATCHSCDDLDKWLTKYWMLKRAGYRINAQEIGSHRIPWAKSVPISDPKCLYEETTECNIMVAPDQTMYAGCFQMSVAKARQ